MNYEIAQPEGATASKGSGVADYVNLNHETHKKIDTGTRGDYINVEPCGDTTVKKTRIPVNLDPDLPSAITGDVRQQAVRDKISIFENISKENITQ